MLTGAGSRGGGQNSVSRSANSARSVKMTALVNHFHIGRQAAENRPFIYDEKCTNEFK